MFDPTVFDNLKIILEGTVYDLDLSGQLIVIGRQDIVELASMNRQYKIMFRNELHHPNLKCAAITLKMDLKNISMELLEGLGESAGCSIGIEFIMNISNYREICPNIETKLQAIWGKERTISQLLSFPFSEGDQQVMNTVKIDFNRLIGEEHIDDFPELISYIYETLDVLHLML